MINLARFTLSTNTVQSARSQYEYSSNDASMNPAFFNRVSLIAGLFCYWLEGFGASYLLVAPITRGLLSTHFLMTLVGWGIGITSIVAWIMLMRKESRVRLSGRVPPFSGNTPRLAKMVLALGAILGSFLATVFG